MRHTLACAAAPCRRRRCLGRRSSPRLPRRRPSPSSSPAAPSSPWTARAACSARRCGDSRQRHRRGGYARTLSVRRSRRPASIDATGARGDARARQYAHATRRWCCTAGSPTTSRSWTGCRSTSSRPRRRPSRRPSSVRARALAALEMIRSGTTTYADMYYFEEEIARATKAAGLRGVLGETIIEFPAPDAKTPADALARAERVHQGVQGRSAHHAGHRAALDVPRSTGTRCSRAATWRASTACRCSSTWPRRVTRSRRRDERHHATPIGYLESIGFWAPRSWPRTASG